MKQSPANQMASVIFMLSDWLILYEMDRCSLNKSYVFSGHYVKRRENKVKKDDLAESPVLYYFSMAQYKYIQ